jgi:hypothetical protein
MWYKGYSTARRAYLRPTHPSYTAPGSTYIRVTVHDKHPSGRTPAAIPIQERTKPTRVRSPWLPNYRTRGTKIHNHCGRGTAVQSTSTSASFPTFLPAQPPGLGNTATEAVSGRCVLETPKLVIFATAVVFRVETGVAKEAERKPSFWAALARDNAL